MIDFIYLVMWPHEHGPVVEQDQSPLFQEIRVGEIYDQVHPDSFIWFQNPLSLIHVYITTATRQQSQVHIIENTCTAIRFSLL